MRCQLFCRKHYNPVWAEFLEFCSIFKDPQHQESRNWYSDFFLRNTESFGILIFSIS